MPVLIDEKNKRIYKWSGNEASLGRTSGNAIQVKHTAVSRHHCVVTRLDGEYFIEDLGSRNGTGMNGAKLAAGEPMLLEPGDTIHFGPLKLRFDLKIPEKNKKAGPAEEVRESPAAAAHEDLETVMFPAPDNEPVTDEPEEEFIEPKTEKTRVLRPRRKAKPISDEESLMVKPKTEATRTVKPAAALTSEDIQAQETPASAQNEVSENSTEVEASPENEPEQLAEPESDASGEPVEPSPALEEVTAQAPTPDLASTPTPAEVVLPSPLGIVSGGQAVMARGWIEPADTEIINWRAVVYGLLIFVLLGVGMFFYRLSSYASTKKKMEEFEFTIAEPEIEEFELNDPQRDIIQEQVEELPDEFELEETPDIQVTVQPTEVEVTQEVIQTDNIEVDTPEIDISATEIDIDAPEEITEISETTTFALTPIAADVPTPADIFKYEKPTPRNKPKLYTINRAPRPSRTLKVLPKAFGDQDVSAIGRLGPANVNLFGTGEFFRAMTRYGGVEARSAVDAALHWLAIHQEPDGHWDPSKHEGAAGVESAITGAALLALMGGGHTTRRGEYRRNVLKGIEWLIQVQNKKNGAINANIYSHSIATIALCEAFGRARDERIGIAARKAVEYLEKGVNPDGGWRYSANSGTSDMSVSGWGMQALKTAKLAQIKFDHSVYSRGVSYVDSLTDMGAGQNSSGAVGYTYTPTQTYGASPSMTAAGMVVRQFSGVGVKSHLLVKGAKITKGNAPSWQRKNFYHWYYATYAMHNMGGEYRIWWNRRIRDVLLDNQSREGDHAGSWDPKGDTHGGRASRVYTTALGALCLEVYYRYSEALNSFGSAPDLDDLFLQ